MSAGCVWASTPYAHKCQASWCRLLKVQKETHLLSTLCKEERNVA